MQHHTGKYNDLNSTVFTAAGPSHWLLCAVNRDDHGNGILIPIGNPMGMGMGRNAITMYGNGNGPYSHGNKFPSVDAVFSLCNSNVQFII